eukprot:NODE_122_length_18870_cov_0.236908.p6 type:complete len:313 gc:universal NODE_122_length_18870_cov_0.236908:16326-15388(-)
MVSQSPELKLSTGKHIPMVGLGTKKYEKRQATVDQVVEQALKAGVRLIETAQVNENESDIGRGLNNAFQQGVVKRDEVFVVGKLWNTFHRSDMVEQACRNTLKELRVDYLDLYIMQWPIAMVPNEGWWPKQGNNVKLDNEVKDFMDTWKAMERLVDQKLVRAIGLGNVNKEQVQKCVQNGRIKPAVVQNEIHPFCYDSELLQFAKRENIVIMAYSPFAGEEGKNQLLKNQTLQDIAEKERLTVPQVLLLWNLSEGRVVHPTATSLDQLQENFNFLTKMQNLPQEEVRRINQLSQGKKMRCNDPHKIFNVQIF